MQELKLPRVSIVSAHEVDSRALTKFYRRMYPHRRHSLPRIWKWLNRSSFYEDQIPLVVFHKNCVIAHAGMIPFYISVGSERYRASWFIDFSVLPEFQGQGLGSLLAKKWMDFSDLHVGFGNEKSIRLLRKLGWIVSFDTHLHIYPLIRFDPSQRDSFLKKTYEKHAHRGDGLNLEFVKQDSLHPLVIPSKELSNTARPLRNFDYLSWRLWDSPHRDRYRICRTNGENMVIKLCEDRRGRYIDLLCQSRPSRYSLILRMIANLALWARERGYFYIRHFTMNGELATYLEKHLKPMVHHPGFIFYAKKGGLLKKLKAIHWNWELMDSDWENF